MHDAPVPSRLTLASSPRPVSSTRSALLLHRCCPLPPVCRAPQRHSAVRPDSYSAASCAGARVSRCPRSVIRPPPLFPPAHLRFRGYFDLDRSGHPHALYHIIYAMLSSMALLVRVRHCAPFRSTQSAARPHCPVRLPTPASPGRRVALGAGAGGVADCTIVVADCAAGLRPHYHPLPVPPAGPRGPGWL